MDQPLNSWKEFWDYGLAYEKTAQKGSERRDKFNPAILYNIAAMGIENFFMGSLGHRGKLPEHHTLRSLVTFADRMEPFPGDLKTRLYRMDRFQDICDLIVFQTADPTWDDVPEFLALMGEVKTYLMSLGLPVPEVSLEGV